MKEYKDVEIAHNPNVQITPILSFIMITKENDSPKGSKSIAYMVYIYRHRKHEILHRIGNSNIKWNKKKLSFLKRIMVIRKTPQIQI